MQVVGITLQPHEQAAIGHIGRAEMEGPSLMSLSSGAAVTQWLSIPFLRKGGTLLVFVIRNQNSEKDEGKDLCKEVFFSINKKWKLLHTQDDRNG